MLHCSQTDWQKAAGIPSLGVQQECSKNRLDTNYSFMEELK